MPCSSAAAACSDDDAVRHRDGVRRPGRRRARRSCPARPPRRRGRPRRTRPRPRSTVPAPSAPTISGTLAPPVRRAAALALVDVAVVDADGLDRDEQLVLAGVGLGLVASSRTSGPPLLRDHDRAHRAIVVRCSPWSRPRSSSAPPPAVAVPAPRRCSPPTRDRARPVGAARARRRLGRRRERARRPARLGAAALRLPLGLRLARRSHASCSLAAPTRTSRSPTSTATCRRSTARPASSTISS